ncbi:MAG: peptidoglycan-binding protein [Rhodobacteraceae bacterium]|nr:peptidoglycan-binding protein [Paracoccaceae bacterium]
MTSQIRLGLAALALAAGCSTPPPVASSLIEPDLLQTTDIAPPGAAPGSCWGKVESAAVVETVQRKVLVQPAQITSDGIIQAPPVYRDEDQTRIVKPRQATWFETPCNAQMTEGFVASVQRALTARGLYNGPVNGRMDARTRAAVRRYQAAEGLDSGILSVAAARKLGLWTVSAETGLG